MNAPTTADVLSVLKQTLRERGLTYRALAERIGMSESGLKKLLAAEDASLSRLLAICEALGLELDEVVHLARRGTRPVVRLSEDREAVLRAHPESLWFLWALDEENGRLDSTATRLGLSAEAARAHVGRLESLDLIRPEGTKWHVTTTGRGWILGRALGAVAMDPVHDGVLAAARSSKRRGGEDATLADLVMGRFEMSPSTARELRSAIHDVLEEFSVRARRERALKPHVERVRVAALAVLAPFDLAELF